jgi:archaemetzincin
LVNVGSVRQSRDRNPRACYTIFDTDNNGWNSDYEPDSYGISTPGPDTRRAAIGDTGSLSVNLRHAFEPVTDFEPVPQPGPHDWLAVHPEPSQMFGQIKDSRPNKPDGTRRKIYLQPLGEFPPGRSPSPERLREYATIYFGLETDTLPAVQGQDFTTRVNPLTHNHQILATDVLRFLMTKLPRDAFCVLTITMEDLYPEPAWNFVFGQASLRERVAVFSFARYDAAFYGQERAADHQTVLLRRSCNCSPTRRPICSAWRIVSFLTAS